MPLDTTLYTAARKVQTYYNTTLRHVGLTFTQFIVLRELWKTSPLSEKELCQWLSLDSGTLTPVFKNLIAHGWIKKSRSSEDGRVVVVSVTRKGSAIQDKIGTLGLPIDDKKEEQLERLLSDLLTELEK